MKKAKTWILYIISIISIGTLSQSCIDEKETSIYDEIFTNGLIKLTQNIGEWNEAIIFGKNSYLTVMNPTDEDSDIYIQIIDEDNDFDCALSADISNNLPTSLIIDDKTYYFDNLGDSIISMTVTTAAGVEKIKDIHYAINNSNSTTRSDSFTTITYINQDDKVHKIIKALDAILQAGDGYTSSQLKILKRYLDCISPFYYYEDVESILDKLNLCITNNEETNDIIYCFTQYATRVKIRKYDPCRCGITVMTHRTPVSVGSKFVILSGRIFCPSSQLKEKTEWGCILSRNPDNLTLSNNERIIIATNQNFNVNVDSLQPKTTYYFKTFIRYKNSKDHGDLYMSYGPKDADSYVDADFFMGEFTTGDDKVEFLGLDGNTYLDWIGDNMGGIMYQSFKIKIPIDYEYIGKEQFFTGQFEWYTEFTNINSEYFSNYLRESGGVTTFGDKWHMKTNAPGEGSAKCRFYIKGGKYIESEWIKFKYDWVNGVRIL